jgi:glycosyltransferase involved in cell wall biosynthesis
LLTRAIASVQAQSRSDFEIIVVVDGPDPDTERWLAVAADRRIRWVINPASLGGAEARNVGVREARGELIAFLDDDDAWLSQKLEQQARTLESAIAVGCHRPLAYHPVIARTVNGDRVWARRPRRANEHVSEYMFTRSGPFGGQGSIGTSTMMAPRSMLLEVPFLRGLRRYQDADLVLRQVSAGAQLVYEPEPLSVWFGDEDRQTISAAHATDWEFALTWIAERKGLVTPRGYSSFVLVKAGGLAAAAGDWHAARMVLRAALRHGRPAPLDLAVFASMWVIPGRLRSHLRKLLSP